MHDPTIHDTIGLKMLGENEVCLTGGVTQNNIPILDENFVRKMNANNGFSPKRMFRQIGSVPLVAWMVAHQEGRNLDDVGELRKYLEEHPEYMTVNRIDTGRDGRIVIK
jgi:hypothetical protein